ncbi:MAG: lipocalin family protein [Alphaproteobacteria bacterium]|nr:lipocalin family protein [Alphaproteobacteria bacterium]
MMRVLACLGLMAGMLLSACMAGPPGRPVDATPLQPVAAVDLARYAGRWYEIARYPNRFERGCAGVTANYAPREDGRVTVINTCLDGGLDGQERVAEGVARPIDGGNNARLAVNFAPIPLPAGQGNYWVLYLDEDYQLAVVGEPSGRFLWFLSRTPRLTPEQRATMEEAARAQGYDLNLLEEVTQP